MDSRTRLLYWLLNASRGGPTRIRVLRALEGKPMNLRKLSMELSLDYKTVQSHVGLLMENGILYTPKQGYGQVLFISPDWEENELLRKNIRGGNDGERKRKRKRKKGKK